MRESELRAYGEVFSISIRSVEKGRKQENFDGQIICSRELNFAVSVRGTFIYRQDVYRALFEGLCIRSELDQVEVMTNYLYLLYMYTNAGGEKKTS